MTCYSIRKSRICGRVVRNSVICQRNLQRRGRLETGSFYRFLNRTLTTVRGFYLVLPDTVLFGTANRCYRWFRQFKLTKFCQVWSPDRMQFHAQSRLMANQFRCGDADCFCFGPSKWCRFFCCETKKNRIGLP